MFYYFLETHTHTQADNADQIWSDGQ